jgi:hypothetical protein
MTRIIYLALPTGVSLSQVYSDFLAYLLQHTQAYFEDHIIDGKRIWQQYQPTMDVVIAHPNGWGIREQAFLRSVAVKAGFTSASDAENKVHFVSEAEASVHFCTFYSDIGSQLKVSVDSVAFSHHCCPFIIDFRQEQRLRLSMPGDQPSIRLYTPLKVRVQFAWRRPVHQTAS